MTAKERLKAISAELEEDAIQKGAEAHALARRAGRLWSLACVLPEHDAARLLATLAAEGLVGKPAHMEPKSKLS